MKLFSLKKVVDYVNRKNGFKLGEKDISRTVKDLITAGFSQSITKDEARSVEKAVVEMCSIKKRTNPLKVTASTYSDCPLCGISASSLHSSMVDVLLADKRRAKFCIEHSVTLPCVIEAS